MIDKVNQQAMNIVIQDTRLEDVNEYKYMWQLITNNGNMNNESMIQAGCIAFNGINSKN